MRQIGILCLLLFFFIQPIFSQPTENKVVAVTVSSYSTPLSDLLQGIAEVQVIVPNGLSAHTWEPKPRDTLRLQKAVLWFGTGEPFEEKLLAALLEQQTSLQYIDLREGVDTIQSACCHHAQAIDPHIWMSPKQLIIQLNTMERELKKKFPDTKDLITERAERLRSTLVDLDAYIRRTLFNHKGTLIVVSHGAYGYFCREYGLVQLAIEKEGKEPTVQEVVDLLEQAKEHHVHTIFTQKQYSQKAAKQIAEQLHATIYELDPYSKDYYKAMLDMTKAIHEEARLQHE